MFDQVGSVVLRLRTHYLKWDASEGSDFAFGCWTDYLLSVFYVEFFTLGVVCDNPLHVPSKYTLINRLKLQEMCIFQLIFIRIIIMV